jgi:hypothetical protein
VKAHAACFPDRSNVSHSADASKSSLQACQRPAFLRKEIPLGGEERVDWRIWSHVAAGSLQVEMTKSQPLPSARGIGLAFIARCQRDVPKPRLLQWAALVLSAGDRWTSADNGTEVLSFPVPEFAFHDCCHSTDDSQNDPGEVRRALPKINLCN